MPKKVSDEQFIAALIENDGQPNPVAKALGLSRQAVYHRMAASPVIAAALDDIRNKMMAVAEGHIFKGVREGDPKYVKWFAERMIARYASKLQTESRFDERQFEELVTAIRSLNGDGFAAFGALLDAPRPGSPKPN